MQKWSRRDVKDRIGDYLPYSQFSALAQFANGEEGEAYRQIIDGWKREIDTMPRVTEQDGKGDEARVYLHYFLGGADVWITELDDRDYEHPEEKNWQCFGMVDLGYGPELGYVCLPEILDAGMEMDLYWTPTTIGEIKRRIEAAA